MLLSNDPVNGGPEEVVGPELKEVAHVEDDGVGYGADFFVYALR